MRSTRHGPSREWTSAVSDRRTVVGERELETWLSIARLAGFVFAACEIGIFVNEFPDGYRMKGWWITIALGIGMTATPFSMLDGLIFRPYPVPHPGGVVTLVSTTRDNAYDSFSYREYLDIRDHAKSFAGVVAVSATNRLSESFAELTPW